MHIIIISNDFREYFNEILKLNSINLYYNIRSLFSLNLKNTNYIYEYRIIYI